ncbi:hypothetical protein KR093_002518, partial [Drosophila rubida]
VEGVWYEIARSPNEKIYECLNVTVPESFVNGELQLDVQFIATYQKNQRTAEKETVKFTVDKSLMFSAFLYYYKSTSKKIPTLVFRITDIKNDFIWLCGYMPGLSSTLWKIFARDHSTKTKDALTSLLEKEKSLSDFGFPEQDECNVAAARSVIGLMSIVAIASLASLASL